MSDCPWCSDVEAPPNSCPLHFGRSLRRSPRMGNDPPEIRALRAKNKQLEAQLKLARRQGYGDGVRDGVISILFFLTVIAIIYMQFRVGA